MTPDTHLLSTDQIHLRPIEVDDTEQMQQIVNHPHVLIPVGHDTPFSKRKEKAFIETMQDRDDAVCFVIIENDTDNVIGSISLEDIDTIHRTAEIGLMIDSDNHSKGIGTEAVQLMLRYGFDHRNLYKVWAKAFADNTKSRGLLEKCGFTQEGQQEDQCYINGERVDQVLYGLKKDQFNQ